MYGTTTTSNLRTMRFTVAVAMIVALGGQMLSVSLPVLAQAGTDSLAPSMAAGEFDFGTGQASITAPGFAPGAPSILPPEVVPTSTAAATRPVSHQTKVQEMVMGATTGHLTGIEAPVAADSNMDMNSVSGMQSAQHMRQAVFNSLMGDPQVAAQWSQFQPGVNQPLGQPFEGAGLSPLIDPSAQASSPYGAQPFSQPEWLLGNTPTNHLTAYGGGFGQTQTLTGGSKIPTIRRDIRRSGMANTISGLGSFGFNLMSGGTLRRPNSLLGLGVTGLTLTGFGVRNGFRF